MNKNIDKDANKSIEYLKKYGLESSFANSEFVVEYKKIHKKAFGYLVLFSEIEKQNVKKKNLEEQSILYLKESVSDVIQSVFVWTNGAYKASDLLLRSSIENFSKAIIGNTNSAVYTEKSVYKIFEMIDQMEKFHIIIGKEPLNIMLHRVYTELCKATHTSTVNNMDPVIALKVLPKFEKKRAEEFRKKIEILIDGYMGFFLANYRGVVENMYRQNTDIFYDVMSKNIIRSVINN